MDNCFKQIHPTRQERVRIQSRRQVFAGFLRYVTLGLLSAVYVFIFATRNRLVRENRCINNGICCDCRVFERCVLPQALSAKQVLKEKNNDKK